MSRCKCGHDISWHKVVGRPADLIHCGVCGVGRCDKFRREYSAEENSAEENGNLDRTGDGVRTGVELVQLSGGRSEEGGDDAGRGLHEGGSGAGGGRSAEAVSPQADRLGSGQGGRRCFRVTRKELIEITPQELDEAKAKIRAERMDAMRDSAEAHKCPTNPTT